MCDTKGAPVKPNCLNCRYRIGSPLGREYDRCSQNMSVVTPTRYTYCDLVFMFHEVYNSCSDNYKDWAPKLTLKQQIKKFFGRKYE